jgi:PTH1 family peptidyl-tRNA hydrolase
MKVIVGLGNPGKKYEKTRHNLGFMVIDALARRTCTQMGKKKFSSECGEFHYLGEKVVLLKPQTYMNLSGKTVRECSVFYDTSLELQDLLVIYDDVALQLGSIRLRDKGSSGGHNGIQSVIDEIGTATIARLRIGIKGAEIKGDLADYVLARFSKEEQQVLPHVLQQASEACLSWLDHGIERTMNEFNSN